MMTELLSLREAAGRLKVSVHTIRAWGYQRRLPIVKLGRRTLFREEDIEKFINKGLIEAKERT
jgi:excisionase family DNA binding protein